MKFPQDLDKAFDIARGFAIYAGRISGKVFGIGMESEEELRQAVFRGLPGPGIRQALLMGSDR
jgi:hypothetical protein